jgi:hypothetical protein
MRTIRLRWGAPLLLGAAALLFAGCATSPAGGGGGSGRSTADPRVRSFRGQAASELAAGTWLNAAGPTSLGALRGRVVYLQFAFPT